MRIIVLSHFLFDSKMKELHLDDSNVESTNMSFISILNTEECLKYYLDEADAKHYFSGHSNVLNVDFDDISNDIIYKGHHFKALTMEQAETVYNFIEKEISNGTECIYIHCRAGISRSRAVGEFIYRYCQSNGIEVDYADRDRYTSALNHGVLLRLQHVFWKKNKMMEYADDAMDYPERFTNPIPTVYD